MSPRGVVRRHLSVALLCWGVVGTTAARAHPDDVPRGAVTEAAGRIVLDGRFDDAGYKGARWHTGFVERKPILRAKPADKTRFTVVYDADAVYVAVEMNDTQPATVVARSMARDSFNIFSDDALSVKVDPNHDHRTTFGFAVNPAGSKLDYKGVNEQRFERAYDMVWSVAAARTSTGWNAEFRIPWSALGVDPANPPVTMGFNLSRDHPRRNATYDWALMAPPYSAISASRYGELTGFRAPRGATGSTASWWVEPYALGGFRRDRLDDGGVVTDPIYNGGIDGAVSLGKRFGLTLSVNTDFAQVDLDDQVVNLTRFGLFLEEKRDFFLSDLELFEFGRQSEAQLLYTRRIGLTTGGAEVPLMTGLKLVGRPADNVRLGLLHVATRPLASAGLPWESHLVARAQVEAGDGSTVGFMGTWRQSFEQLARRNLVLGLDGTWRGSGSPFLVNAFAMLSLTGAGAADPEAATGGRVAAGDDKPHAAAGFDLTYRDQLLSPRLTYAYYQPEFRADLGFFRRVGGHQPGFGFDYVPRFNADGLERLVVSFDLDAWVWDVADPDGERGRFDWSAALNATLYWEAGYYVGVRTLVGRDAVLSPFSVGADTDIAPGDYDASTVGVVAGTPAQYVFGAEVAAARQDFFGGVLWGADLTLVVKPSTLFRLDVGAGYDRGDFDGAARDFHSATVNARMTFGFTPHLGLSVYTGWNYLADQLRVQARLRWTYLPGSDLFVVYQLDAQPEPFSEQFQSLLLKLTFHYPWEGAR